MNPHARAPIGPLSLLRSLVSNRELIMQLTKRDIVGRYRGSMMGLVWSLVNPILLLIVYTVVFSVVFKARWGTPEPEARAQFATLLFAGMIVHTLFSEVLTRAPGLILANVSYVKKVVFPLEVLPVVAMGTSIFHAVVSIIVLIVALAIMHGNIPGTSLLLPIVFFPLIVITLGISWALASLGVFIRDVAQPIGLAMTILLFASPVFYPIAALPEELRPWLMFNPLTFIIEQTRNILIYGNWPDWTGFIVYYGISAMIAWTGYAWFQKTRKGFANVL